MHRPLAFAHTLVTPWSLAALLVLLFLGTGGPPVHAAGPAGSGQIDLEAELARIEQDTDAPEAERLAELFDLVFRWGMQEFPEGATLRGWPDADNRRWSDQSPEAQERREMLTDRVLETLLAIDRSKLGAADRLNYDLYRQSLEDRIEARRFPGEVMPINQMGGIQQWVPTLLTMMPNRTVEQAEDILGRMAGVPGVVDQTLTWLRQGIEQGVTPPRVTLRDVAAQIDAQRVEDPTASPIYRPFATLPESISAAERERLQAEARRLISEVIVPAYDRLHRFWTEEYFPATRESIALADLPDGAAWYAFNARSSTTTDLTPREIHEIGLAEVARIRAEMETIKESTGFEGTLEEFFQFLRTDPQFFFETPEELVAAYREIAKRADPQLVALFGTLPRLPYGVEPVPSYAEKSQTTAYYQPGSADAGRAGTFYANTYDLASRPKWEMEALTLHEAVPGHHLQIALAQELEEAPEWRKQAGYTAFTEGWGLYAESLGEEMGFYQDPYAKFGQLTYEMWRAIRLVVDTGMHALGWSRDQAIEYFQANAGKAEHDIVVEVDRYIVWPGQALAYKIGELEIQRLRKLAERELGERFDIRAFHDTVLGNGAVPLNVLADQVQAWIAEVKTVKAEGEAAAPAAP